MELKEGYKKTEVGIIPEDWDDTPLNTFIEQLLAGVSVNSISDESNFGGIDKFILKTSAVYSGVFNPNESKRIAPKDINRAKLNPTKDSIIISRMNTPELVGECGYVRKTLTNHFIPDRLWQSKLKSGSDVNVRWLSYILSFEKYRKSIKDIATGTSGSMKNISKTSFLEMKIPYPRPEEQTAIATALSDTDALITSIEELIAKKRMIKQGTMQKLLTPKEDWEVKKLGEVCEIIKGQLITEKTRINGNIPVIAGGKTIAYYHNEPNRIGKTITISGSGASAGYVSFHSYPIFASDCSTISENENYSIEYIYYVLLFNQLKIYQMQTGGAQPHIHPRDVYPLLIPIFEKKKQFEIATILSDMDSEIEALETKLAKYKQIKQGMMQQLLTGKIRLVNPQSKTIEEKINIAAEPKEDY